MGHPEKEQTEPGWFRLMSGSKRFALGTLCRMRPSGTEFPSFYNVWPCSRVGRVDVTRSDAAVLHEKTPLVFLTSYDSEVELHRCSHVRSDGNAVFLSPRGLVRVNVQYIEWHDV